MVIDPDTKQAMPTILFSDYRDHHPWNPTDGGYRDDGCFYGTRPYFPAAPDATPETDTRLCAKCGMQRVFNQKLGHWMNVETGKEADGPGKGICFAGFSPDTKDELGKPQGNLCDACLLKS